MKKVLFLSLMSFCMWIFIYPSMTVADWESNSNFWTAFSKIWVAEGRMDAPLTEVNKATISQEIIKKIADIVLPILVVLAVVISMIWLYKILISSDTGDIKTGIYMLVFWVIWIILMYSASSLTNILVGSSWLFRAWKITGLTGLTTRDIVETLYDKVLYPFIKIAIYLSLWFLVIVMMTRVFKYITAQDDSTKKQAIGVIVWTTIGMVFITIAKEVVEAVYWSQKDVLEWGTSLSEIWANIVAPENLPTVFKIINWALWLSSLALLVVIIFQTYKMLVKPEDSATFSSLKKTILYALGGILLIGCAYLLANLFIVK